MIDSARIRQCAQPHTASSGAATSSRTAGASLENPRSPALQGGEDDLFQCLHASSFMKNRLSFAHVGHDRFTIHQGDCLEVMRGMADASIDSIVTDPPYELGFMGKSWDASGIAFNVDVWREALRVLKPGGHLLAFGGSRTYHRMACAIEDAGFEIRDQIMWLYGCLDEATEVATEKGVMPYHKTKIGDRVLCYDVEHGEYTYQPILEIVEYDYSDTAFRLVGDFGEQVVSRNHRVIVERGGSEVFQIAETLECEARVPVLEDLSALRQAIHDAHQGTGRPQQDVRGGLCECFDWRGEFKADAAVAAEGCDDRVRGLRGARVEAECLATQGEDADVQQSMQRQAAGSGVGEARAQGSVALVSRVGGCTEDAHDGQIKPIVEGRYYVPQPQGCVCGSADQVCTLPGFDATNGPCGRVRDGAPPCGGTCNRSATHASGMRAPHQPRCDGQPTGKPDAVRHECPTQGVRAWRGHRSAVVRVVPFHYTGKVWCLRVPTGAFVAVRNGVAFPTGNSGFPKSKNLDGAWKGWGTALKPAHEPIVVARKPLVGTVAANVLEYGTGALNIDGCRVATDPAVDDPRLGGAGTWNTGKMAKNVYEGGYSGEVVGSSPLGRWPANVIHDGSDEVLAAFPDAPGQQRSVGPEHGAKSSVNCYGDYGARDTFQPRGDTGSAARFFYCAKASRKDRNEGCASQNNHPTVKPTDLMAYLCRLVTPPGGVVLDPFMGSGSTGKACMREGFRFIGIDLTPEYVEIARARIDHELGKQAVLRPAPDPQMNLFGCAA